MSGPDISTKISRIVRRLVMLAELALATIGFAWCFAGSDLTAILFIALGVQRGVVVIGSAIVSAVLVVTAVAEHADRKQVNELQRLPSRDERKRR